MSKVEKRGRPTIMTDEIIAKLEEAFAWGCSDIEACLWAGIDARTLYKYQEKNPGFSQRKAELKETPILLARKSVITGLKRDPKLAIDFLARRKKDEFSTRSEVDATVRQVTPIMSLEEDNAVSGNKRDQEG